MIAPGHRLLRTLISAWLAGVALTGCGLPDVLGAVTAPAGGGAIAYVMTNLDPQKATVAPGEVVTLWIETNVPESRLTYAWTASGGSLSATQGSRVRWTAGGSGRVTVRCVVSQGAEQRTAEYLFTVR